MNANSLLSDVFAAVAVVVSQTPCVWFPSRTLCIGHQAYLGVSIPTVLSVGCVADHNFNTYNASASLISVLLKANLFSYDCFLIT